MAVATRSSSYVNSQNRMGFLFDPSEPTNRPADGLLGFSAAETGQLKPVILRLVTRGTFVDERISPANTPASEAVATTGLFLMIASVIAIAVSLASWGASDAVIASVAGTSAVLAFVGSLVCFGRQANM